MLSPSPQALPLEVVAAGETDRGCVRETNEDALLLRGDLGLYIVADGAGGHEAGNVASAIATAALAKFFDDSEAAYAERAEVDPHGLWTAARRLSLAVQRANAEVIEIARSSNRYRGMGTTVVSALVVPETGRLHVAHVGDSRCYRLRQGVLELMTHDHSILNEVVELYPELDDAVVAKLPRQAVSRALGMEPRVRVAVRTLRALVGDRYLLCSDGLTAGLGDGVIEALLGQHPSPLDAVRELVAAANEAGGRDNITAVVLDCRVPEGGPRVPRPRPSGTMRAVVPPRPDPAIEFHATEDPEIVLLAGSGSEDSEPRISVVPVHSADAATVLALDRIAHGTEATCPACGARAEGADLACPRCGHTDGPASAR